MVVPPGVGRAKALVVPDAGGGVGCEEAAPRSLGLQWVRLSFGAFTNEQDCQTES